MKYSFLKGCSFLVFAIVVMTGCSSDESVRTDTDNASAMRSRGESEFEDLFDNLYPGGYTVSETPVVITDRGRTFYAYQVRVDVNTEGYILEVGAENYYYENSKSDKIVTEYNVTATGIARMSHDMSHNNYYLNHGLNPTLPSNPVATPAGFWGWEVTRYGNCSPPDANGNSYAGVYATHYIFWIGGTEKEVFMTSPAGNIVHAYVECTGNPLTPGSYTGEIITF
ncbi:hypothetical protein OGH69_00820 [Flavobacterium sp. MFBS3-15]|uniref:hypothetical protein n=1 Tax=Flavobacterium sp. MFBS3-15 TaxID=2989816 RepID=UPI002235945A|nr:hypothetical protein [Flavobacterium sp. MFBS3-15]MCW4467496.1 hypothetical protein [Flavobacterium sp. MFBS3-15]